MPVMDGYAYADTPHAKTVVDSSFRYGCHDRTPTPQTIDHVQSGWHDDGTRRLVAIVSNWLPIKCGHIMRLTDPACTDCINRTED